MSDGVGEVISRRAEEGELEELISVAKSSNTVRARTLAIDGQATFIGSLLQLTAMEILRPYI